MNASPAHGLPHVATWLNAARCPPEGRRGQPLALRFVKAAAVLRAGAAGGVPGEVPVSE